MRETLCFLIAEVKLIGVSWVSPREERSYTDSLLTTLNSILCQLCNLVPVQ